MLNIVYVIQPLTAPIFKQLKYMFCKRMQLFYEVY